MTMTQAEMQDRIITRAGEDEEFRTRLVADPKAAIQELTGQAIPDGTEVQVHEESATSFHLVLPPSGRLAEAELAQLVGGMGPKREGQGSGRATEGETLTPTTVEPTGPPGS